MRPIFFASISDRSFKANAGEYIMHNVFARYEWAAYLGAAHSAVIDPKDGNPFRMRWSASTRKGLCPPMNESRFCEPLPEIRIKSIFFFSFGVVTVPVNRLQRAHKNCG
jgi:hypothetical protein